MFRSILAKATLGLVLLGFVPVHAMDYYLSNSGDDKSTGNKSESAWKSLERANQQTFQPGDRLLLKGGEVFTSGLKFDNKDGGDGKKPVMVGSFGTGKAIIEAGDGTAIDFDNAGGFVIENLIVRGSGYPKNQGDGIIFRNVRDTTGSTQAISIRNVEASGFAGRDQNGNGIYIAGLWHNVQITDCETHHNRFNGIFVNGAKGISVLRCKAWENAGDPEYRENWSGNGIFVAGSEDALIDHCVAWRNGYLCPNQSGGPVGIWSASTNKVVIQYCHSYENGTNGPNDGGGFDFDGGVTNGLMQYNYAHDNDGPGYLIYEWGDTGIRNIVMRHNVSVNDGRKNLTAGLLIASAIPDRPIDGCLVEHNTFVTRAQPKDNQAVALRLDSNIKNVQISNNTFVVQGMRVIDANVKPGTVRLVSNKYTPLDGANFYWNGVTYDTFEQWQKVTGQEAAVAKP